VESLKYVNIRDTSPNLLTRLINKYHYFIFTFSDERTKDCTLIGLLKLILRCLQDAKIHHAVYINSNDFNSSPLIRFLLPKLNSRYTEFYFPLVKCIKGYQDLRLLDNTNCYFSRLEELTIGSLSFQLFNLKAPKLKVFNHSDVILDRAFSENVCTDRISYTKFFDNLRCSNLNCLEVIGTVNYSILNKFNSLKILRIYADNTSRSFDMSKFRNLEELVITKCPRFTHLENIEMLNQKLRYLDLSNNRNFHQHIIGNFQNLKHIDLSNTALNRYIGPPSIPSTDNSTMNSNGCISLKSINY